MGGCGDWRRTRAIEKTQICIENILPLQLDVPPSKNCQLDGPNGRTGDDSAAVTQIDLPFKRRWSSEADRWDSTSPIVIGLGCVVHTGTIEHKTYDSHLCWAKLFRSLQVASIRGPNLGVSRHTWCIAGISLHILGTNPSFRGFRLVVRQILPRCFDSDTDVV